MDPKETEINKTLDSLERISRAQANPYLFQKVMNRMEDMGRQVVTPVTIRWALATLALLIGINVLSILHSNKSANSYNGTKAFQSEYFSYINNSNL